jgi:endonuclease/exonuclease/phosphatase (EEP) superfamily protein YafD
VKKSYFQFPVIVVIYVVLISAWFVSWLIVGDSNWWLIVINRIVPYLFIPALLFLAGAIFSLKFGTIIPLLLPILIFGRLYHPYLLPKFAQSNEGNSELRVMTYNVLYSNLDYDAIANVILAYQPDLVALQEVLPETMDALEQRLTADYPYSSFGADQDYGTTAVFSRYPLTDAYTLDLQAVSPAVVAKTKIHDKEITFVAVHLLAYGLLWVKPKDMPATIVKRTAEQNRQAEIILEEIENEAGIVIIGCDCNTTETASSYRILDQSMDNAARQIGWRPNEIRFANVSLDTNLQHIDYVWYRGELEPVGVYTVNDSGGSDHLPVLAIFNLQ